MTAMTLLWIVVVLTTFLSGCSSSQLCSRELTRNIRRYLKKEIFSIVSSKQLPETCLLNPVYDRFNTFDYNRQMVSQNDWKCQICGKHFVNEYYLDRHMEAKHPDQLVNLTSVSEEQRQLNYTASFCLSDLCPLFGCPEIDEHFRNEQDQTRKKYRSINNPNYGRSARRSSGSKAFSSLSKCDEDTIYVSQERCQHLADTCFPDSVTNGAKAHKKFTQQICEKIECKHGVLQGGIQGEAVDSQLFFFIVRIIAATILVAIVVLYLLFTDKWQFLVNYGRTAPRYKHLYDKYFRRNDFFSRIVGSKND